MEAVFIAHASADDTLAEAVTAKLAADGVTCFNDGVSLRAGEGYEHRIKDALDHTDVFVYLVREQSVRPDSWPVRELELFRRRFPDPRGRVLPFKTAEVDLSQVPAYVRAVITVQEPGGSPASAIYDAVTAALAKLLDRNPGDARESPLPAEKVALVLGTVVPEDCAIVRTLARLIVREAGYEVYLGGKSHGDRTSVCDLFLDELDSSDHQRCRLVTADGAGSDEKGFRRTVTWTRAAEYADFVVLVGSFGDPIVIDGVTLNLDAFQAKLRRAPRRRPWLPIRTRAKDDSTRLADQLQQTIYGPTPTALSADLTNALLEAPPLTEETLRRCIRALRSFGSGRLPKSILADDIEDIIHDLHAHDALHRSNVLSHLHAVADSMIAQYPHQYPGVNTKHQLSESLRSAQQRIGALGALLLAVGVGAAALLVSREFSVAEQRTAWDAQRDDAVAEQHAYSAYRDQMSATLIAVRERQALRWGAALGEELELPWRQLNNVLLPAVIGSALPVSTDVKLVNRRDLDADPVLLKRAREYPYAATVAGSRWNEKAHFSSVVWQTPNNRLPDSQEVNAINFLATRAGAFSDAIDDLKVSNGYLLERRKGESSRTRSAATDRFLQLQQHAIGPLIWSYVGFGTGLHMFFPATPTLKADYKPPDRGWYVYGRSKPGTTVVYGPYRDVFGAREHPVITLAAAVDEPLTGVAAIDVDALGLQSSLSEALADIPGSLVVGVLDDAGCLLLVATQDSRYLAPPSVFENAPKDATWADLMEEDLGCVPEVVRSRVDSVGGPFRLFRTLRNPDLAVRLDWSGPPLRFIVFLEEASK